MALTRSFQGGARRVELGLDGATFRDGEKARTLESALDALAALHRRATALVAEGLLEDVDAGRGSFEDGDLVLTLPMPRAELERRLGVALAARKARALPAAVPLLLLEWPVGHRFAELFEAHPRDRAARAAVAARIAVLSNEELPVASELFRVALEQKNEAALDPALALLPRVRGFDTWMDVLELAYAVGTRKHAPVLRALAKTRVPADVRDAATELAAELGRRR